MTDQNLDELIRDCPTLFHMAECGAWPSIERDGLLSTAAILDRFGLTGDARAAIESRRRPACIALAKPGLSTMAIRDQKPLSDAALARCLTGGMTPADWYRLLNGKVFFWLSARRLAKLLAARPYRDAEHDVLELATAPLVAAYRDAITLSPINSGSTIRNAVPRGPDTFRSIEAYDYAAWRLKRPRRERVIELAVTGAVPDIARFVTRVTRRRNTETLSILA